MDTSLALPADPMAMIFSLHEGYVLLIGGRTVACPNLKTVGQALTRGLKSWEEYQAGVARAHDGIDPSLLVRPTAELESATEPPASEPTPIDTYTRKEAARTGTLEGIVPGVNPLVVRDNLLKLCAARADEEITQEQFNAAITQHCPGVSMKEAQLTLNSFLATPPGNRVLVLAADNDDDEPYDITTPAPRNGQGT